MKGKNLVETIADWCKENNQEPSKILVGEWLKTSDHPIPQYEWCLVSCDEGVLVAYHTGDNEWDDGRIAHVYYWMPLPADPSYPTLKTR